jgi:co-chaperonin GroES (HSP10)
MRPLYDFIVRVENLFKQDQGTETFSLIRDTRWDDFEGRISYGTVVSCPEKFDTPAEAGDTIMFHHHISQEPEKYSMGGDLYRVSYDPESYQGQSYCVIKPTGEVHMLGDWIFLEAYEVDKKQEDTTDSGIFLGYKSEGVKKEAVIYCDGEGTQSIGVKKGDTVGFSKNSDYELELPNGDKVYRCKPSDLEYVQL